MDGGGEVDMWNGGGEVGGWIGGGEARRWRVEGRVVVGGWFTGGEGLGGRWKRREWRRERGTSPPEGEHKTTPSGEQTEASLSKVLPFDSKLLMTSSSYRRSTAEWIGGVERRGEGRWSISLSAEAPPSSRSVEAAEVKGLQQAATMRGVAPAATGALREGRGTDSPAHRRTDIPTYRPIDLPTPSLPILPPLPSRPPPLTVIPPLPHSLLPLCPSFLPSFTHSGR